ncbi:MAG: hydrolase [Rariglobus sp.]|jgi:lysophospholipase L1-like esterase|nr:hydrolase [Rariglobus sp.]
MHSAPLRLLATLAFLLVASPMPAATVANFATRAEKHEPLSIVFLGGSLTWGANASDPNTTSYRGRMMRWLREKYPRTPLHFHDAAIGGTGSALALFRLDRDVLSKQPDLVFLDFTVNDDLGTADAHSLATYERILRELRSSEAAVIPVLMSVHGLVVDPAEKIPARYAAHQKLADAYGLITADTLRTTRTAVAAGRYTADQLYPIGRDRTHPDDAGYGLFFEAVRDAYLQAAVSPSPSPIPAKFLTEDRYPFRERRVLVDTPLPAGWTRTHTCRTSMWFDGLSSRWMGDVARATAGAAPLETTFRGSFIALIGERSPTTPPFRVWIDDRPIPQPASKAPDPHLWNIDTSRFASPEAGAGNLFAWTLLAKNLADGGHTLRIEPVFTDAAPNAELRIESLCSAGR